MSRNARQDRRARTLCCLRFPRVAVKATVGSFLLDNYYSIPSKYQVVNREFNARVKLFKSLDGNSVPYELMVFNYNAFGRVFGKVPKTRNTNDCSAFFDDLSSNFPDRDYLSESRRRAIKNCRDIGMCNPDLSLFVTLTLDSSKIDRYDYAEIISKLNIWLDNRVRRNGLKYLVIPELHKDGAVHFHGLFNDVLDRRFSGVVQNGKRVFNLPDWTLGFTNCMRITGADSAKKVTEYIIKYITKSVDKVGGRFYLHGGKLDKPQFAYYNIDIDTVPRNSFFVADGIEVRVLRDELTISELTTKSMSKEVQNSLES